MNDATIWIVCASCAALALVGAYQFYRRVWFGRDPPRAAPAGARIVAPADGRVLYVAEVTAGAVPISVKGRAQLPLDDIVRGGPKDGSGTLIGLYLSPFDVHHQRSPIRGVVREVRHHPAPRNAVMESMFWRNYLRIQPMYTESPHIWQNERNVIHIVGERDEVWVVQIADYYVNRIECAVRPGDTVDIGQRIGMIHAGSQVDLFIVGVRPSELVGLPPGRHVQAALDVLAWSDGAKIPASPHVASDH